MPDIIRDTQDICVKQNTPLKKKINYRARSTAVEHILTDVLFQDYDGPRAGDYIMTKL